MLKFAAYRALLSLLVGILGYQTLASRSLLAQSLTQAQITQQSCAPTNGLPLNKNHIELRGAALGFSLDSNTMGRAFQNFALDSVGKIENTTWFPSRVREIATSTSSTIHRGIVPDAVGAIEVIVVNSQGQITQRDYYGLSSFHEAKFTTGTIYLSSFAHQIIGYIDVAKNSSAGRAPIALGGLRPTPVVFFLTPSNATIAASVIITATNDRVAVYQRIACDAPSTPSTTDMIMGSAVLLNSQVYAGSFPPFVIPSGRVAGLR
ncbi:hypothetical protein [Myxacorys almedinensis]|uniref:Uncharacterized protein n=1 Tax=Myxacorys almedinensis A TaxID=2690445 RepID=A0A8J7Z3F2_9CYAN|nr:hypothetical protein [Myxacorys almedinensis]NDJ15793.1 hypothetical protein [Myxacorys almedinensis A]